MSFQEKFDSLKSLTKKDLSEICKSNGLKGYSKFKQKDLARFVAENLDLAPDKVIELVNCFWEDKMVSKIKDAEDYILRKDVLILNSDNELIQAKVGKYDVMIYNLGEKNFKYICEGGCNDFNYQVKNDKYPFCKHYPAVIAELIYEGKLDVVKTAPNHISGVTLNALNDIIETRRREDGIITPRGRDIDNTLCNLKDDLVEISLQNSKLARDKYHESYDKVFESLVNEAFQLLEFETIPQRREQGWDLLVLGTYAPKPYMVVVECKTAKSGVYDHLVHNPDYLYRLKDYCLDMVKDKLMGVYKDYMKYLVIVAPDFPDDIVKYNLNFKNMTGGIQLSFLPVSSLLYLVERYRENPILTHYVSECLFHQGIISKDDIDKLFVRSEEHIEKLIVAAKESLRNELCDVNKCHADECYIKLDEIMLKRIIDGVLSALQPYLLKQGINEGIGVKTISIKHDYYKIWNRVLKALTEEFTLILEEQSLLQTKRSDLKEDIIKYLEI
ncbi:MAG: hypothetical protein ACLQG5_04295 [Methanobacterium sp.]|jgi:hypothetical protein